MDTEKLTELAVARLQADEAKTQMNNILDSARNSVDFVQASKMLDHAQAAITILTEAVKAEAVEEYLQTNVKQLPGVTVKVLTSYVCSDEAAARQYALEKDQTLLLVDMRSMTTEAKKLAGTKYAFPFFREEHKISPQIKSDLSEFLPQPEMTPAPAAD